MQLSKKTSTLAELYDLYKKENPKSRIRDAAKALQVSEAELVHCQKHNILLKPDFRALLNELEPLGEVMALTRNDYAVHERKGTYSKASFHGNIGLVVNPDIDLRLFMNHWKYVFAVSDNNRLSIQFFDTQGDAIHKVFLTEKSNEEKYHSLVQRYKDEEIEVLHLDPDHIHAYTEYPDEDINIYGFQMAWKSLKDTHDFFPLLKKYQVTRIQALRLAPKGFSFQIPNRKTESLLNLVSSLKLDFMVFVGNRNCLQIHTGPAHKIVRTGPWINILDEQFNLHLQDQAIESLWIVRKPTSQGIVHSIEAFDAKGNLLIQFFGKRKMDIPESEEWRLVIQSLENVQ